MTILRVSAAVAVLAWAGIASTGCNALTGLNKNYTETSCPSGDCGDASTQGDDAQAQLDGALALDATEASADGSDAAMDVEAESSSRLDAAMDASPEAAGAESAEAGADACADPCTAGATRCSSPEDVQTCETQASGCTAWVPTSTCTANQTCTVTANVASCACSASQCTQVGTVCQDSQTVVTCAKDSSGCFYASSSSMCESPKSCSGMAPTAMCSTTCSDSCTVGQKACTSAGLATCATGSNGCLSYGTGMSCGVHESCTGSGGSATCACSASVCTSTSSVCASTSSLVTCAQDAQGCFYEASTNGCTGGECLQNKCGCTPGATQCSGTTPQTCDGNGNWQNGSVTQGKCGAACNPGTTLCASASSVETCSSTGAYLSTACATGVCSSSACITATAIATGNGSSCAILSNGSVECWPATTEQISLGQSAIAIAAGNGDDCAILADHSFMCWYFTGTGGLVGVSTPTLSIKAIAIGYAQMCAVLTNGTVDCWDSSTPGSTPVAISGLPKAATAIATTSEDESSCALLSDGTVWCWGGNYFGELGDGTENPSTTAVQATGVSGAVAIAMGGVSDDSGDHTCALLSDGVIECWGGDFDGEIGHGETLYMTRSVPSATPVTGITPATSIAAGDDFSCAALADGTARCWGYNGAGQLGDGSDSDESSPQPVSAVTKAVAVSAGGFDACELNSDGTVQCWGNNSSGQLGSGSTAQSSSTPVPIPGL